MLKVIGNQTDCQRLYKVRAKQLTFSALLIQSQGKQNGQYYNIYTWNHICKLNVEESQTEYKYTLQS